jgi:hypothetical protein
MWKLFFAFSLANAFACAQQVNPQPEGCKIRFAIVWSDNQAGTAVPGSVDDMKWLPKDARKKYPEVCYDPSATGLRFVVNFNGHYTDQSTTTHASPMDGTITDRNGNKSTVTGTVTTTVPSSTSYNGLLDERTFHVCETPSCARRFAPSLGYVDMVKGQIDPTERAFRDCEKSSIHRKLSKAIVRVQDGEPVWECIRCLTKGSDVRGKVFQLA